MAVKRFRLLAKHIPNSQQKSKALDDFNKWKRSQAARRYWVEREGGLQEEQVGDNTNSNSSATVSNSSATTSNSSTTTVRSISLPKAKELIRRSLIDNVPNSQNDIQSSFHNLKLNTLGSITDSKLLDYESNLQHLMALSNILFIKIDKYDSELDNYFINTSIDVIKENVFRESLNFDFASQNISCHITNVLVTIIRQLETKVLTKPDAIRKMMEIITDDMDKFTVKLLLCFTSLISTLPSTTQPKKIQELELCSRYSESFLQPLFDSDEGSIMFKWINTITFRSNNNESVVTTKNRPDGIIENESKTTGFVEVKTIESASNHNKIDTDLYRLDIFGKTALDKYGLKKTFQVMAIGTNLQFYICQYIDGVCVMNELAHFIIPISLIKISLQPSFTFSLNLNN